MKYLIFCNDNYYLHSKDSLPTTYIHMHTHTPAHIDTQTHTQFGTKINGGIYMPGLDKEYEKYVDQSSTVFAHLMSNAVQSTAK